MMKMMIKGVKRKKILPKTKKRKGRKNNNLINNKW